MTPEAEKRAAAAAALERIDPGWIVGVGTGSTANHFIEGLGALRPRVRGAVASSVASAQRLRALGVAVLRLEEVDELPIYVDGADEATADRRLIKGGGGALTREKIIAAASRLFVCIVDRSKLVERLGRFPLPIEVIPMARRHVAATLERWGGRPRLRPGFTTDNGNVILDVHNLPLADPVEVEGQIDHIPGVVTSGLFCRRPADVLLIGGLDGVRTISAPTRETR